MFLSAILPIRWYIHFNRQLRHTPYACPNCRYDLRATTTGICPECGTPFDPKHIPPQLASDTSKAKVLTEQTEHPEAPAPKR
jgi:predicted amidophosphoribosyltransferase